MIKTHKQRFLINLACIATAGLIPVMASAQLALDPHVAEVGPESDVPVAIQNARWHMNDADINVLTFRSMETLFTTRTVARSGNVSVLPREDSALDFDYQFEGRTYKPEEFLDRTYTNAMLVMKNGKIVYENYLNNSKADTHFMGWSMTKSLTSLLVGIALEEGRIRSLDDDITDYLPELKSGAYKGVTIRQVLQMRSGVDYEESYDFDSPGIAARNHIQALVKNVVRFVDAARDIERAHPPGKVFQYKTIDTAVLGLLVERVSDGSTLASYLANRLWEPLGAESNGFFIMDGEPGVGREFSGAGFNATLRDYARIGELMLNEGEINGRRIVSRDWVRESVKPAGPEEGPMDYGYQWWTVSKTPAYSAIGLQGQFIFVDPSTATVIVKLSYFPPEDKDEAAMRETFSFFEAASKWNPGKDRV
ncbi:serine hydrolase domain-containing protein [Microbulbifer mangrovi]|uniref:serine hydrolase domain-containing protein n=1 Tax=Microbulbifer mangrovi TaxID=927787 RepID=UPI00099077B2|nr:serine hydrolase [Microbulbifer mangrovi]